MNWQTEYAQAPDIGEAERIWLGLNIDKVKISYGDYRNDLEPLLKWKTPGGKWYSVGRVCSGYDPCELAEQIQKERGLLADGQVFEGDVVEVIARLVEDYRVEMAYKKDGDAVSRYLESNGLRPEEAQVVSLDMIRRGKNGGGGRRHRPVTHYRRAGEPAPEAALASILLLPSGTDKRSACLLMWKAGLRIAEALELSWSDLMIRSGNIYVRRGKGGKSRFVPLEPGGVLEQELMELMRNRSKHGKVKSDDHVILTSRAALQKWLARKLDIGAHQLRHTCGHDLAASSLNDHQIAAYLGHGNTSSTDRYTHLSAEDVSKALGWGKGDDES